MGLRGPAAVALWMPVRGEDLWRNCEGIGRPSGLRGASSADLKKKQSNSIDVGLASPRDKPRTSREPLSGRSQGAPIPSASGKSENRKEGKTSTWPRLSPERQKDTRRWGRGSARSPRGFYEGNPNDARCRTRIYLSVGRKGGPIGLCCLAAASALLVPARGRDLSRNCEGIGTPSGLRGASSAGLKKINRTMTLMEALLAAEIHRKRSVNLCRDDARGPQSHRLREKARIGRKGKRLPGPDSLQRDKRILDGWGGAPRGAPEAYTRGILVMSAAEQRGTLQALASTGVSPARGQARPSMHWVIAVLIQRRED